MRKYYYIQNTGFCGDCIRWWRKGGAGYTSNLDEAWRVTEATARKICKSRPREDIPRPAAQVDRVAQRHVNFESVRHEPWWDSARKAERREAVQRLDGESTQINKSTNQQTNKSSSRRYMA